MIIVVGLGNPGKKFENTPHNVGFMVIDKFAKENTFPSFRLYKKYNALISRQNNLLIVKPQTYMNKSGESIEKISKNFKNSQIIIIHDDVDLPLGKIKIVKNKGSGGHKGVESIIETIGKENLIRVKIGISPEKKIKAEKIVLKKFLPPEKEKVNEVIKKTIQAIKLLTEKGVWAAMNEYNK